jgi:hypothetical protein
MWTALPKKSDPELPTPLPLVLPCHADEVDVADGIPRPARAIRVTGRRRTALELTRSAQRSGEAMAKLAGSRRDLGQANPARRDAATVRIIRLGQ